MKVSANRFLKVGAMVAFGMFVALPAWANPPGTGGNGSQNSRQTIKVKFVKVAGSDSADKYSKGVGLRKETNRLKQLIANVRIRGSAPAPGTTPTAPEVALLIPQAGGEAVRCVLAASMNSKGRIVGKLLIEARKKTDANGQPSEELRAKKGSCESPTVPAVVIGSDLLITVDGTNRLTGVAR